MSKKLSEVYEHGILESSTFPWYLLSKQSFFKIDEQKDETKRLTFDDFYKAVTHLQSKGWQMAGNIQDSTFCHFYFRRQVLSDEQIKANAFELRKESGLISGFEIDNEAEFKTKERPKYALKR